MAIDANPGIEEIINLLRTGTTIEELEEKHGVTRADLQKMLVEKRSVCGCSGCGCK